MCAITMVFNSSFHIEVTAAEEDGEKEEGKRLRGGGGEQFSMTIR